MCHRTHSRREIAGAGRCHIEGSCSHDHLRWPDKDRGTERQGESERERKKERKKEREQESEIERDHELE